MKKFDSRGKLRLYPNEMKAPWKRRFILQTSPARNGKLDGKGGGNKGIDGWEETVMGSGVSSVRFVWCGAVLWRYGKFR